MINNDLAQRYAKVLFNLDLKENKLQSRLEDFKSSGEIFSKNPKFLMFLKAPQLSLKEKENFIRDLLKDRYDHNFLRFLNYLIEKKHLENLEEIAYQYRRLVNQELGIWEAEMITAVELKPEIENSLKEKLQKIYKKTIKINRKIDPSIIGGAILIVDNQMIDWSVETRLKKIKENLLTLSSCKETT